jgi:SH3-like domain-containing protein
MIRQILLVFVIAFAPLIASAQPATDQKKPDDSTYFASLRSDEVNVRAGPGVRYQVKWVFVRKHLPVMITAEFESWRKIKDSEGAEGWVHRAMLSSKRSVVVTGPTTTLRRSPSDTAPAVARLATGMVAELESCQPLWCNVTVQSYSGWLKRTGLWGLKDGETIE